MPKLFDRVKVNIATSGTGTVTFGPASSPAFLTPAEAGAVDTSTVRYILVDGTDFEEGVGTILSSVAQMDRTTVVRSKIGGVSGASKINLSGTAVCAFVVSAVDIANLGTRNTFTDATEATGVGTTAAAIFSGGVEILKKLFVAGVLKIADTTNATTTTTGGALNVAGGIAANGISYLRSLVTGTAARDALNPNLQAENSFVVTGSSPDIVIKNTAGGTDSKYWDMTADATALTFRALNDAFSAAGTWLSVVRSGITIVSTTFFSLFRISNTTDATSTTTGSFSTTGGASVAKSIVYGGALTPQGNPNATFMMDGSGMLTTSVANGSSLKLPIGAGRIMCLQVSTGEIGEYFMNFGTGVLTIESPVSGKWVAPTTTPTAGHCSVAFDGANYAIYNNIGSAQQFVVNFWRIRPAV